MCLAVPFELKEIKSDGTAVAERGGLLRTVDVSFIREPKPGDHVIVHAGFAIERINAKQAMEVAESYDELMEELRTLSGAAGAVSEPASGGNDSGNASRQERGDAD